MFGPERALALLIRWLVLAVSVWVSAWLLPGIHLDGWGSTMAVALILGLLNLFLRPLLTFVTLPLTVLTLGLFLLVVNAILLGLASWIAGWFDVGFHVDNFWSALLGAIIISLTSLIIGFFVKPNRIARDLTGGW